MFDVSFGSWGAAPDWYEKLRVENPLITALVPWNVPASYGTFFSEGWGLEPNRRYISPYPTFEYMTRAVDGIRKYNEQSVTWVEQMPYSLRAYGEAGKIFVETVLDEAYKKCLSLLDASIYNSAAKFGLEKTSAVPWYARYSLYAYMILGGWTSPLSWAGVAAINNLKKAPDYLTFLGSTVRTIIKVYNIAKKYQKAFENTVKTKKLDPALANLPTLADEGMLLSLKQAADQIDQDSGAVDELRRLGVLPNEPDTGELPTLPDPVQEEEKPPPAWYWWVGAVGAGAVGAAVLVAVLKRVGKKKDG